MAPKKLSVARLKQLQSPKPSQVIAHGNMPPPWTFPTPLPTVSTSAPPTESQLLDFLKIHLKPPMTSQTLLHFLKHKLHYHPIFTHLDFHIFQWATTVDSFRHDHHSYEWMVRTLAVSDRFDALQSLLLQEWKAYGGFELGFFRERKFEEGIGMAYEMIELGYGLSRVTCEILINGLCMGRKVLEACELLIDLAQRGVVPRDFDGLVLVENACADGNVERATKVVKELWKKGNAPSLMACTTLVEGLRRTGDIENAIRLVTHMINEKIIADSVTFNCLIRDACAAGKTTEADKLRVLASDKGLLPDGVTYSSLVAGYTREGKTEEGERLVNEMLDAGFIPDIVTYNRLINGLHPHHKRVNLSPENVVNR
ncbi:Pentatricopeptide repeat-containing protein [Drosera capensis]